MSNMFDLTRELERRAASSADKNAASYFKKFQAVRDFVAKSYYPYIQSKCPYFTDHGEAHIDGVIWAASQLLAKPAASEDSFSAFDIYLLLMAIIWHDAGMVSKRKGHETAVRALIDGIAELALTNVTEKRLVEEIIAAHTGRGTLLRVRQEESYSKYTVYPRALAALLRFADEISEDASRISIPLLKGGQVPLDQQIFWYYAKSIQASHPQPVRERVSITVQLDCEEAVRQFPLPPEPPKPPLSVTLIDYLMKRIEKAVSERAYCAPHFLRYVSIQSIEVCLSLLRGSTRVDGYEQQLDYGPVDEYPEISIAEDFFKLHPKWRAEELRQNVIGGQHA
jgi:hypothetical protein